MTITPTDLRPSESPQSRLEKTSEFIGRLRGLEIVKKLGNDATDLKVIGCYLQNNSFETQADQESLTEIFTWFVDTKAELVSDKYANEKSFREFEEAVNLISNLVKTNKFTGINEKHVEELYEIISKFIEIKNSSPLGILKGCLVHNFEIIARNSQCSRPKKIKLYGRLLTRLPYVM
jgi:hypothetical protein